MKSTLLICLTILIGCQAKKEKVEDRTIEIYSVDMDIETIISIKCTKFMDSFDSAEFKIKYLNDDETVDNFLAQLGKLELDSSDRGDPDTRAKIIVKITSDTICADRFSLKYRDKYYLMSDELRRSIWTD
jgi:hypothetical protein